MRVGLFNDRELILDIYLLVFLFLFLSFDQGLAQERFIFMEQEIGLNGFLFLSLGQ